jgi:hypothetical protein
MPRALDFLLSVGHTTACGKARIADSGRCINADGHYGITSGAA